MEKKFTRNSNLSIFNKTNLLFDKLNSVKSKALSKDETSSIILIQNVVSNHQFKSNLIIKNLFC